MFEPVLTELDKSDTLHDALGQGEDNAFLAFEMAPGMSHGRKQQLLGLLQTGRLLNELQAMIHFLVFLKERIALANLFETMFQRPHKQTVLGIGMAFKHGLEKSSHDFDFGQSLTGWRLSLDLIEQVVKDQMFSEQGLRDLHGV
jgi:hypothetical protein